MPEEPDATRPPTIELLVATDNVGKSQEYRALLRDLPAVIRSPNEKGLRLEVAETGTTFAENATLKARAFAAVSGMLVIADDSGLEVDALGGRPGVYSARYAGPAANDSARIALLLDELHDVPWERRTARFRCVIAVCTPHGHVSLAEGTCEGSIAFTPSGAHGFGYDPIFFLPHLGRTMAQLSPEEKNSLSHRARAAAAIKPTLRRLLSRAAFD